MNSNSSEFTDYFEKLEDIIDKINDSSKLSNDNSNHDSNENFIVKVKNTCPKCSSGKNIFQDKRNYLFFI